MTKTLLAILASITLFVLGPAAFGQQEAVDEEATQADPIDYPRTLSSDTGTVVVYTPQIDTWKEFAQIEGRVAVAVTPDGEDEPVYGVLAVLLLGTETPRIDHQHPVLGHSVPCDAQQSLAHLAREGLRRRYGEVNPELDELNRQLAGLEAELDEQTRTLSDRPRTRRLTSVATREAADAAYLHYTPNETIGGVEFDWIPDTGDVPLVADMSSTILSRPLEVSRYGLIYAGAQKNIGPAGLTVVIVRDELLGEVLEGAPSMYNYRLHADAGSMLNTPPTYGWYLAGLVFRWLGDLGGLQAIETINRRKATMLYQAIDGSDFYHSPVRQDCRSLMNVPFTLADSSLDGDFLASAGEAGLLNLKGHRSVGGMRASIYNAMPEAGVTALVSFMQEFERSHG